MANHEGRAEYGGSFATARAGADHPCAAQKSGISRKNSDALSAASAHPWASDTFTAVG